MWIFTKRIEELREADLLGLTGVIENQYLEFKEIMYPRKDPGARFEMLRDVSSIANAEGGVMIFGMAENEEGRATAIVPVPDAQVEADRLVSTCLSGLKDRIAGLRTHLVPVEGGHVVLARIPTSYRKPHMVVADGANELWIRHDRQKSRMAIDEIRSALLSTEDLEMKAERFIQERRQYTPPDTFFSIGATPLSLQGGRVDVNDPRIKDLLRNADYGKSRGNIMLTAGDVGRPTLRGRRVMHMSSRDTSFEVFRNGHVELLLRDPDLLQWTPALAQRNFNNPKVLHGHSVAEYIFRVLQFCRELTEAVAIPDPYLFTISFWRAGGFGIDGGPRGGGIPWTEGERLFVEPVLVGMEEELHAALRRILDPVWNGFGHERYAGFDANGRFIRPE